MNTPVLTVNMQVRCSDGSVHDDVQMFVQDNRKVFIDRDGIEIVDVESIEEATSMVPPIVLANIMIQCKEVE